LTGACSHGGIYSVDPARVRVDFSSSVNPLGAPRGAIRAIEKGAGPLAPVYPDPECRDLKKAIARHLGVGAAQITVGNGAVEIIYWFARLFAKRRVVVPAPTFCEYELAAQKAGAQVTFVPLMPDFGLDPDAIIREAVGADAVFLCNPNNPTGMLSTREVRKVVEGVAGSTKVLLDECFIELVDRPQANTLISMAGKLENLVILRSLTKSFGMAGLRVGYSVSSPALAEELSSMKVPWNVNGLAQAAAVTALTDKNHLVRTGKIIKRERQFLQDRIAKMESFVPLPSDANYFLVQLKNEDSASFRDKLLKKTGVLVRDCSTFTGMGSQHVRIAVRTRRENAVLLSALEEMDSGKAR
jgi:threonine-phosphate decarboxylase